MSVQTEARTTADPGAQPPKSWTRGLIALGLVVLAVAFFLPVLLAPTHFPADDAYFYAQVARNIVAGKGTTFNGITATNGYHPLWMVFCIGAAAVTSGGLATIRLIMLIDMALTLVILWLYVRLTRDLLERYWVLGLPVLIVFFTTGLYLSEAHINAVMVLASLVLLRRAVANRASLTQWFVVGVVLGFAILARLDNVFFVFAAIVGVFLVEGDVALRLKRAAVTAVGAGLVTAPYLLFNVVRFGHVNTISGAIKTTFPHAEANIRNLGNLGLACALVATVSVLYALIARGRRDRRFVLLVLGAGVLMHAAYVVLFTLPGGYATWSWYYVLGVLNAAIFAPIVVEEIANRLPAAFADRWIGKAIAVGVAVILVFGGVRAWARYANANAAGRNAFAIQFGHSQQRPEVDLAYWMGKHLPKGSRVAVFDIPGQIAYFSGLNILPLDGLISDYKYEDDIRRVGAVRYFADHGVKYYVGPINPHTGSVQLQTVDAPLYRQDVGQLKLEDARIVARLRDVVHDQERGELGDLATVIAAPR